MAVPRQVPWSWGLWPSMPKELSKMVTGSTVLPSEEAVGVLGTRVLVFSLGV